MNKPLLIHVGFHKTGTTWLQDSLFQEKFGYRQLLSAREIHELFVAPNFFEFEPDKVYEKVAGRRNHNTSANVDVISSEILCGNPFFGGRETNIFADRLKKVFPEAYILIGIREQKNALRSTYMQYLSRCGTMKPQEFFNGESDLGYHGFSISHFMYYRIVELYQELFGKANVFLITQEGMAKDLLGTVQALACYVKNDKEFNREDLLPERVGVSYPEYVSQVQRRVNHFRSGPVHRAPVVDLGSLSYGLYKLIGRAARTKPIAKFMKNYKPVYSVIETQYGGKFAESNLRLRKILDYEIDLSGYEGGDL